MRVESLIESIVEELKTVKDISAIVLGGSRARGTHTPSSDIDLGVYYRLDFPLNLHQLRRVATALDDSHRADLVTDIGGWGPWINGGGWLTVQSHPVDFLYRDLEKITAIINDCLHGKVEIFYQPGHPHGFVTSIYPAEVAICQPLLDPEDTILRLKKKLDPYPALLQKALIQKFAWEIDFSLQIARKSVERADVAYAAGCCFRSVMCMLQILFAINGQYWLNEKGAVALADAFAVKPAMLQSRIEEVFRLLDADSASIQKAIDVLRGISDDIGSLTSLYL